MRLGVLSASPDGWHARDLERAARAAGIEPARVGFEGLSAALGGAPGPSGVCRGDLDLGSLDLLLVRSIPAGSLEQVVFRMDLLHRIESAGVPVVNPPRAIEGAVDKYLALARIEAAGLPVPRTRAALDAAQAQRHFEELGGDTVVKPVFGSAGRGLLRVSDRELAGRAFRTLERLQAVIYQQEFVPHPGGDLRILVVGGEAALAMRRRPQAGPRPEWRANVARGGEARQHALSPREVELACRAARAVGAEVAGVDLLPAGGGALLVSEVNSAPGWRALARATGADVAALVVEHLLRRARR